MDSKKKLNDIEKIKKRESRTRSQTRRISMNKYHVQMNNTKNRRAEKTQSNESLDSNEDEEFDTKLINLKNRINEIAEEHKMGKVITLNNRMFKLINKKLTEESKDNEIKEFNNRIEVLENENEGLQTKIRLDNERIKNICDENDDQISEYTEKMNSTKEEIKDITQITHYRAKIHTMEMETEEMQNERTRLENKIEKLTEENADSKNVITILQKTIDELNNIIDKYKRKGMGKSRDEENEIMNHLKKNSLNVI